MHNYVTLFFFYISDLQKLCKEYDSSKIMLKTLFLSTILFSTFAYGTFSFMWQEVMTQEQTNAA